MTSHKRVRLASLALLLVFGVAGQVEAQWSAAIRYARGQSIQPVFEGWEQNPDGTYTMWFGYLNRNWEERLTIPVGTDNNLEPGGPDRGQPTVFHTGERRRQIFAFKVALPATWPKDRDVVWTVTANGVAQRAIGSLWPAWMVDSNVVSANRGAMRDTDPNTLNKPPVVANTPTGLTASVNMPLTVTLDVVDDDMPKRRKAGELVAGGGVVVPSSPSREGGGRGSRMDADGNPPLRDSLRVTWVQWRGPGSATIEPDVSRVLGTDGKQTGTKGQATTKIQFDKPGTYVLKAYAEDMSLFSVVPDITVTVTAGSQSSQP